MQSEGTNNSPLTSAKFKAWLWPQGTAAWRPHRHVYTNKHCVNTSFLVPLNHPHRQKVEVRARSDRVEHRAHLLQSPRAVQQKKESTGAEKKNLPAHCRWRQHEADGDVIWECLLEVAGSGDSCSLTQLAARFEGKGKLCPIAFECFSAVCDVVTSA